MGDNVLCGGQVGIKDHVTIGIRLSFLSILIQFLGSNSKLAARSAVLTNVPEGVTYGYYKR